MVARDELIAFLDDLLEAPAFEDYGPNGLQVPGSRDVRKVVTGVSAHGELFERAAEAEAQLVLCHHGLFWSSMPLQITPQLKGRLETLFAADLSLAAYHLPLDAHAQVGNNALICEALGLERTEPFGEAKGRPIGFVGRSAQGLSRADLLNRCRTTFGQEPLAFESGPETIRSVGVVSGGGAGELGAAAALGLDALLTGEPAEPSMAEAREGAITFIAAGHYATETFGVRRLGELIAERYEVEQEFIAVPNPV
jgi:dinuclear metal center YbgI/SA1388 family protein